MIARRNFLRVLAGAIAAPAVVRIDSIMPVRAPALVDLWGVEFVSWPIDYQITREPIFPIAGFASVTSGDESIRYEITSEMVRAGVMPGLRRVVPEFPSIEQRDDARGRNGEILRRTPGGLWRKAET